MICVYPLRCAAMSKEPLVPTAADQPCYASDFIHLHGVPHDP